MRRIAELVQNQEAKRRDFYRVHDKNEIRAMLALAYRLFGNRGLLEASPAEPGVVYLCCWEFDDPHVPAQRRRRQIVARGNSLAELVAQAELLDITAVGRGKFS